VRTDPVLLIDHGRKEGIPGMRAFEFSSTPQNSGAVASHEMLRRCRSAAAEGTLTVWHTASARSGGVRDERSWRQDGAQCKWPAAPIVAATPQASPASCRNIGERAPRRAQSHARKTVNRHEHDGSPRSRRLPDAAPNLSCGITAGDVRGGTRQTVVGTVHGPAPHLFGVGGG